jgi:hypothetical protein
MAHSLNTFQGADMKTSLFFSPFLIVILGISSSCITTPAKPAAQAVVRPEATQAPIVDIEPGSLVGTKWVGFSSITRSREALEFIDESTCIYISRPDHWTISYTTISNRIYLGENDERPFVLKGNILYDINGFPLYIKAE